MSFLLAQTSTNYITLLDDLVEEVVKQEVGVAAINAAGSGYTALDVLTISGGTGTSATLTVLTVGGSGEVTSVEITTPGRYTVFPTSPASVTGGTGTGATFDLTPVGWEVQMETQEAVSAAVAAGGTGYSVGDQLTLVGGTLSELSGSTAAVFNVDSESAGAITAVSLVSKGKYDFVPSDPVSTTVSPAGGTGATLNVTWQGFTGGEKQVILKGNGSVGTDEIYVGIGALDFGGGITNWNIRGFTGFQQNVNFSQQPGISPSNSYVPLNNGGIRWWLFVNPRRIALVARMGGTYTNMYLGLGKPFATAAQYPYPLVVMGCSSIPQIFSSSTIAMSGMTDPINVSTGSSVGPGYIRTPGGFWRGIANSGGTSGRLQNTSVFVWPCGSHDTTTKFDWTDFIPPSGNPGTPSFSLRQTPDSTVPSGWVFPLISTLIIEFSPDKQILAELEGVYWSGTITELIGQAISEDQYDVDGQTYHLFQNCNRTDPWAYFLIKEE